MPAIDELAKQANTSEFHKSHFGGFLMGKNAKKSLENWERATEKDATPVQPLIARNFDNNHYAVLAFSTSGDIAAETLSELRAGAEQLAAENNLRAHGYTVQRQVGGRISSLSKLGMVGSATPRCTSSGRFQAIASWGRI